MRVGVVVETLLGCGNVDVATSQEHYHSSTIFQGEENSSDMSTILDAILKLHSNLK